MIQDTKYIFQSFRNKKYKLFNDRNKSRVNDKRSCIGSRYLFGDTSGVQLYTLSSHFCNNFFLRRKLSGAFNLQFILIK